jgi:hypothetical protein
MKRCSAPRRFRAISLLASAVVCCALSARAADYTYTVVMKVGDAVPGLNAKLNNIRFAPRLNPSGAVVVNASMLPNGGGLQFVAIVQSKNGALRGVARQYVPSPSGENLAGIGDLLIQDDAGHVLFNGTEGDDVLDSDAKAALFCEDATGLHLVAREGDAKLESTFTSDLGSAFDYVYSNAGVIAFNKVIRFGPNAHTSLWLGSATSITRLARQTEAPPGTVQIPNPTPGFPLRGWRNFSNLQLSSTGRLVFGASVQVNGPQNYDGDGIWAFGSGQIGDLYVNPQTTVALPTPPGGLPYTISLAAAGGDGPILVTQSIQTPSNGNFAALFSNGAGNLTYEIGLGAVTGATDAIAGVGAFYRMSSSGRIVTFLNTPSVGGYGLVSGKEAAFTLLALNNQQAPGLPDGVKFKLDNSIDLSERGLALSPNGGLVFLTELQGAGVNSTNNQAIYFSPADGGLELVARTGNVMTLAGGNRTPSSFEMSSVSGGNDGLPRCHTDSGKIAFLANFTTGPEAVILASPGGGGPGGGSPPAALNDTLSIRGTTKLDVLANDSDPDDDPLKITAVTKPAKGSAKIVGGKFISYTPGKTFDGTDTFSYTITAAGETSTATVTVNNPFLAWDGGFSQIATANGAAVGTVTAKLTTTGAVTGKLIVGGKTYTLRGNAGFDGTYTQTFKRKPAGTADLVVTLHFTSPGGVPTIAGSATGDASAYAFAAGAAAATTLPDGLEKSVFTVLLPADATASNPRGFGWATAKLAANGKLTLAGKLADGTPFTASAPLSTDQKAQLYIPLYTKPRGSLSGTLTFAINPARFAGTLNWTKPVQAKPGLLFPGGFTATTAANGALYAAVKNTPLLTFTVPGTPRLQAQTAEGGIASVGAGGTLSLTGKVVFDLNDPKFKVALTRATGKFSGSFIPAAGEKALKFSGVLHQGLNFGAGSFTTTDQSGAIRLVPQ